MKKTATTVFWLLAALLFVSGVCDRPRQNPLTEVTERRWWNAALLPGYRSLDSLRHPGVLRHQYDSLYALAPQTPFSRALAFEISGNYSLYFSHDWSAGFRALDSALALFPDDAAQRRYPRTYLGYLLFAGDMAYRLGHYTQASDLYFRAKRQSDLYLPRCDRSAFTYAIAMVLYRQQAFDQSAGYFREAFAEQSTCGRPSFAIALQQQEILSNIGLCFQKLQRPDSALRFFDSALRYAENYRDLLGPVFMQRIRGVLAGNQAAAWLQLRNFAAAEPLLQQSLALVARPNGDPGFSQGVRLNLAILYRLTHRYVAMAAELDSARRCLDTIPDAVNEQKWNDLRAILAAHSGDAAAEQAYFIRAEVLRDSLNAVQRVLASANVSQQIRDKELDMHVAMLESSRRFDRIVFGLLAVVILLGGLLLWAILRSYRRNQRNLQQVKDLNVRIRRQQKELDAETARRQKLVMEAVIQAQEAERTVIGLELHDNVNQILTTVKLHNEMVLDGIGDPQVILRRAAQYLQQSINEIRGLSKRLSAPTLGKISLTDSVAELAESINLTGRLRVRFESPGPLPAPVRQDAHLALYRIIQEALNNTVKHAGAREAIIRIECTGNEGLFLLYADDGAGFDPHSAHTGIGMTNMVTRAESLGGSCALHSRPGAGCRIEVHLPHALLPLAGTVIA